MRGGHRAETNLKPRRPTTGGLVYSTDAGRMCPGCRAPVGACRCAEAARPAAAAGPIRVGRQTQGRAGKTVTRVDGLPPDAAGLAELAKRLKALCGSGGTVKAGGVEIQGDHVDRIVERLRAEGRTVRRTGG